MSMYQNLGDRLKEKRKGLKLTQQDVADRVKVSKTSVVFWEKGENIPKHESLLLLASVLETTPEWLLKGGEVPSEPPKNEVRIANVIFGNSGLPNHTSVKIPVYREVKAACGNGNEIWLEDVSEYLDIDPKLLKLLGIQTNPDHLKIIFSDEYSMWPTVAPETPLFIDVQENDPSRLRSGKVYVFTHNYHLRMKRVFVNFDGSVRFTSDNPDKNEYPDEVVTAEQAQGINLIGRLVWFGNPA